MGGGDLNLKKSWHPSTFSNLKKLWEAEQVSAKEQQKLEQLRKEKLAERDAEDLRKLQERAGILTQKPERVEWMYLGSSSSVGTDSLAEDYLLGKRRFGVAADMGEAGFATKVDADTKVGSLSASSTVHSTHEMEARLREDPLFIIRKKEKEFLDNITTNPVKFARSRHRNLDSSIVGNLRNYDRGRKPHQIHETHRSRSWSPRRPNSLKSSKP